MKYIPFRDLKKKYQEYVKIREHQGCKPINYNQWLKYKERENF